MPNPVVHFELIGRDAKKLQDFYSGVFDWTVDANNPMAYGIVDNHGEGIGGGIAAAEEGSGPRVTIYISVDDIDAYLRKIEAAGGKTTMPKTAIPGMVTMAMFTDPDGNLMGLVDSAGPPPA